MAVLPKRPVSTLLNEVMLTDNPDSQLTVSGYAQFHIGISLITTGSFFLLLPWRPSWTVMKLLKQVATVLSAPKIRSRKRVTRLKATILRQPGLRRMLSTTKALPTPNLLCCFLSLSWSCVGDLSSWFHVLSWPQALLCILYSLHQSPVYRAGPILPWTGPMTPLLHYWLHWTWPHTSEAYLTSKCRHPVATHSVHEQMFCSRRQWTNSCWIPSVDARFLITLCCNFVAWLGLLALSCVEKKCLYAALLSKSTESWMQYQMRLKLAGWTKVLLQRSHFNPLSRGRVTGTTRHVTSPSLWNHVIIKEQMFSHR